MFERELAQLAERTRHTAGSGFTTAVFGRVGLDRYGLATSLLGDVFVAWTQRGVAALRRCENEASFERWYGERFARTAVRAVEDDGTLAAVAATLLGEPVELALDLGSCSPFEAAVLRKAAEIPRGGARTYGWIARELALPGASRAVGSALGRNPVPLLIPCHRVIRASLTVGEYVFGSDAKRRLLEAEGLDLGALAAVARQGYRYIGCDDGSFCLPTCGDVAARLGRPGYAGFHSLGEVYAAGLQPCDSCRPLAA